MMEVLTASVGSYPKIGDGPGRQLHRHAYARWERGEISNGEFERIQDQVTEEVIREQVIAGLDIVTDGQVRWYDPISHIARNIEGCEIDGLLRFFDTNFYFRQPVIMGRMRRRAPILKREFEFAASVSPRTVKPVITGPYTLARLSIDRREAGLSRLVEELSQVVSEEVGDLAEAGAKIIQIDEPAILGHPEDLDVLRSSLDVLSRAGRDADLILHVYFGDPSRMYSKMLDLPVGALSFDFTYGKDLVGIIEDTGCDKDLGIGIIDGRNTRMEAEEDVVRKVGSVLEGFRGKRIYLCPSCGLEYLPRDVAFRKLQNLARIAGRIKEGVA